MDTGFADFDVAAAFTRERRRHSMARLGARLRVRRPDGSTLLQLEDAVMALGRAGERSLGVQTIALDSIAGTVGRRSGDFDRRFRPASRCAQARWQSIATARRRGRDLPPIEVFRVGAVHFVQDGHHRVSVARAHGDTAIDARVREVRTRWPAIRDDEDHQHA